MRIPTLPAAAALDGTEIVPVSQAGDTKRTTVDAVAGLAAVAPNYCKVFATGTDLFANNAFRKIANWSDAFIDQVGAAVAWRQADQEFEALEAGWFSVQANDRAIYVQSSTESGLQLSIVAAGVFESDDLRLGDNLLDAGGRTWPKVYAPSVYLAVGARVSAWAGNFTGGDCTFGSGDFSIKRIG